MIARDLEEKSRPPLGLERFERVWRVGDAVMTSNGVPLEVVSSERALLTALVVTGQLREASAISATLENHGFDLMVAQSFATAKSRMSHHPPTVLITDLRLGEFNGLHLVLGGKSLRPTMTGVVISDVPDAVLQAEAEQLGATFVMKPLSKGDLLAIVFRMMFNASGEGAPVRPPFERRRANRRSADVLGRVDLRCGERRRDVATLLRFAAAKV